MADKEEGSRVDELREKYTQQLDAARQEAKRLMVVVQRLEGALIALNELEEE